MIYLGMDEDAHKDLSRVPNVKLDTAVHIKPWPIAHPDVVVPVAPGTRYVAIDNDGLVHCYSEKPTYFEKYHQWLMTGLAKVRCCGEVGLEGWGFEARESCVEVQL